MSNLRRFFMILLLLFVFILSFYGFTAKVFASSANMNLSNEANITDEGNPGNNVRNNSSNNSTNNVSNSLSDSRTSSGSLDTNTATTVQSVDQFEDSSSSFGLPQILNILLLAVGFVIILLAVAILIRLGK